MSMFGVLGLEITLICYSNQPTPESKDGGCADEVSDETGKRVVSISG